MTGILPAIILVRPQMAENIGACARAMANCGLRELRLVAPRDGWPNDKAIPTSTGAFDFMDPVRVFDTTADALADCHLVFATTARHHDLTKHIMPAGNAARMAREAATQERKTAFLFGPERTGLESDDAATATHIVTIPLQEGFQSLNLAQAVLLMAYEWMLAGNNLPETRLHTGRTDIAPHADVKGFMVRLQAALDDSGFFKSADLREPGLLNLENFLMRAQMTLQEVRTWHGILTALTQHHKDAPTGADRDNPQPPGNARPHPKKSA